MKLSSANAFNLDKARFLSLIQQLSTEMLVFACLSLLLIEFSLYS